MVYLVMACAIECSGFDDQAIKLTFQFGRNLQPFLTFASQVQEMAWLALRSNGNLAEVRAANHRRVNQCFQRNVAEARDRAVLRSNGQRRAELPVSRQP